MATLASLSIWKKMSSATCGSKVHMVASGEVKSLTVERPPRWPKYSSPITNNKDYWYASYGAAGNFDQTGTTIGHFDTPTNYMWGATLQRQISPTWAVTGEYLGVKGVHLVTNVWNWSLNNVPLAYYGLGTHLSDQVPNPFFGQSQTFSAEPTLSLSQLLGLSPQYAGNTSTTPGQATWGKSFSHFANFQIQSRGYQIGRASCRER